MKLCDLAGDLAPNGGRDQQWPAIEITGLTADSRLVQPGFLFAALPGTSVDGAQFIPAAVQAGAAAILLPKDSPMPGGVDLPVIAVEDPRRALALMAARFYGAQPQTVVAVTGTNGKTSVASFVRQIWQRLGHRAASLGTVGLFTHDRHIPLSHTTPEPVELQRLLAELAAEGVDHLALEASSHGLQQRRLDGIRFAAGGFTNISRDHLDYHPTFADYFQQKLRLFDTLLPDGAAAVIDIDSPGGRDVQSVAQNRGLQVFTVGRQGQNLTLLAAERDGYAQRLKIAHEGQRFDIKLPLVGGFQVQNALVAAGLCIVTGAAAADVLPQLAHLQGARGRLELAATTPSGAPVFIDYAHTPDALANALAALRPYARGRLVVVFGCGGDRDQGKRPEMGRAAVEGADIVYVTDDNPRSEDPATIRKQIMAAAPGAIEIAGRGEAIAQAIANLAEGDLLLVAGKGHETGQIIGTQTIPFSDHEAVRAAIAGETSDHG